MTGPLRRFAAVGLLVTLVDVGALLLLRLTAGLPVAVADVCAIALAAVVSYAVNRALTFTGDPKVRWVQQPRTYVALALAAGAVDVGVLSLAVMRLDASRAGPLLVAKLVALVVAGAVRQVGYRRLLFGVVRDDQAHRVDRVPLPGDVRLSVVIPAYREAARIGDVVHRLRQALAPAGDVELVVVDDGSGDGTADAARAAGAEQVLEQPVNRGKGAAVRVGALAARGRTVVFTDADLAYPPEQLLDLLAMVEDGWDVVVGSRRHVETATLVRARRLRETSGRLFNLLTVLVLLGQYRDTQCGIKAFRSDVAGLIFEHSLIDRFAFDVEVFHLAERYRLSLAEVPVTLANSTASTVRLGPDALRMVLDLFRMRGYANRGRYDVAPAEELTRPN